MIERSSIDEVMQATDVVDVVGDFVYLKRRGSNMIGLCPFHDEKTPSFSVSPSKQIYKCFGCGEAGNSVSFLMNLEKMSYVEAIRWLANKYNIELKETEVTEEKKEELREIESLSVIYTAAQRFFHDQLLNSEEGKLIGLSYFHERGIVDETIENFGLGYCPESNAFYDWATENGYQKELLLKAGLISDYGDRVKDKYAGRVIFPIRNLSGKVVGFGARILDSTKKTAKYLNSPENELYHKSKILYGLDLAKRSTGKEGKVYMTEGYMDVLSMHQNGFTNTVSSSGTALTIDQVRLLKKYTDKIVLLFDSDEAGLNATQKAIELCMAEGMNVGIVRLDEGEDPDSYMKKNGAEEFQVYAKENEKDFVDFTLERFPMKDEFDVETKDKLAKTLAQAVSKISRIEDLAKQSAYNHKIAVKLDLDEKSFISLVNKYKRSNRAQEVKEEERKERMGEVGELVVNPAKTDELDTEKSNIEMKLLKVLLSHHDRVIEGEEEDAKTILDLIRELKDDGHIYNPQVLEFLNEFYAIYDQEGKISLDRITQHDNAAIVKMAIDLSLSRHKVSKNWKEFHIEVPTDEETEGDDIESTIMYFQLREIKKLIQEDMEKLKDTQDLQEMRGLQEGIRTLKDEEMSMLKKLGTIIIK